MPTMFEKTKESLGNAAEYTKECAESAKEAIFGEKNAEDKAADKVRDAADWTSDTIGEVRAEAHEDNGSLMDAVKEKMGEAVEYTKECAHSAKEMIFGEETAMQQERGAPVFAPKENTVQHHEIFKGIRENNEDTDLPHAHDY